MDIPPFPHASHSSHGQPIEVEVVSELPPGSNDGTPQHAPLLETATAFFKNPLVIAGGAVIAGLLIARVTGRSPLKGMAGGWLADLVRSKMQGRTAQPQPEQAYEETYQQPRHESQAQAPIAAVIEKILPVVGANLKKRLAELLQK